MKNEIMVFCMALIMLGVAALAGSAEWGKQGQNVISPTTLQSSITTLTTNSATKATFGGYTSRTNATLSATTTSLTTKSFAFAQMTTALRAGGIITGP